LISPPPNQEWEPTNPVSAKPSPPHKLRRSETFLVTGWSPDNTRRPATIYLARPCNDGTLRPAGAVHLGLRGDQRAALHTAITQRLRASHRRIQPVDAGISVTVHFHGSEHRPLRDPVIRDFSLTPPTPISAATSARASRNCLPD
jgi:hypothetical protein